VLWLVVTMSSLLVGMVALGPAPSAVEGGRAASRLLLELPEWALTLAMTSAFSAVMLAFAYLIALARRRRKDDDLERGLRGVLFLFLLLAFAALWREGPLEGILSPLGRSPSSSGQSGLSDLGLPSASMPAFSVVVAALMVGAGLTSLALVCWLLFGERLTEWWRGSAGAPREPLGAAVEESLDDLHLEPDPRRAIIRCYRRFEVALAESRVARAPWQTPMEFMREALGRLPLPAEAVRRLTGLFELARFSDEPMAPEHREAAWASLSDIRGELDRHAREARAGAG
jgi:hypothetical protein